MPLSWTRSMASRRYRRSLFSTTIDAALRTRAIATDDTNRDFLDNTELKKVLETVKAKTGRKVDIVGFDACLMSLAEVAFQVRSSTDLVVASEETEPNDGWPYDTILADLAAKPSMTPAELGKAIVKRYVASFKSEVTLALLDVDRGPALAKAVKALGGSLAEAIAAPGEFAAVTKAIRDTQRYYYRDFVDLYDLCDQLAKRVKSAKVKAAAKATQEALSGPLPFVVAEAHKGTTVVRSHGAAIYVPRGDISVVYDRLDFAKASGWGKFIAAYLKA
ncbi:MAG: hypothetical protein HY900_37185 [Deltaproteobacteria bacterium]|nr:hypothetical protein [Deltaproteobacteria bacterium]